MKICPVGDALFNAGRLMDRRTDMVKLSGAFRSSANTLTNSTFYPQGIFMRFVWLSESNTIICL